MKNGLYTKLAWTGIQKNRKLYLPYMLTCIGMVMMCYIVSFLKYSPVFGQLPGGDTVQAFLNMGFGVMCVFSLLFLFFTPCVCAANALYYKQKNGRRFAEYKRRDTPCSG